MVHAADPYRAKPYLLDRTTAPAFWLVRTLWLPMATGVQTGNRLALIDQLMPTGLGPPAHSHPIDEGFYVLEGRITFIAAGQSKTVGAGGFVHLPRTTEHTFVVESGSARVLNFYTPAGFEMILMSVAKLALERRSPTPEEAPMPPPDQVLILSRLFGMAQVDVMPFIGKPTEAVMATKPSPAATSPVHIATADAAPAFDAFGLAWRLLAGSGDTGGAYNLFEVTVPAGAGFGAWVHAQDQALYVLEGEAQVLLDGQVAGAGAGTFAFVPAGTITGLRAGAMGARLLMFHLPGGLDQAIAYADGGEAAEGRLQTCLDTMGTRAVAMPGGW